MFFILWWSVFSTLSTLFYPPPTQHHGSLETKPFKEMAALLLHQTNPF